MLFSHLQSSYQIPERKANHSVNNQNGSKTIVFPVFSMLETTTTFSEQLIDYLAINQRFPTIVPEKHTSPHRYTHKQK
jgi:hypothetical protein